MQHYVETSPHPKEIGLDVSRGESREENARQDDANQIDGDHRQVGAADVNRELAERIDHGTARKGGRRKTPG